MGEWSLGQILHHLAASIRLSMAPGPQPTTLEGEPEQERVFQVRRRKFFKLGRFPEGAQIPHPSLSPPTDADERASAESLRSALSWFETHEGPMVAHPLLGRLSKAEWVEFHRIHCIHHLGFVRPTVEHDHERDPEPN